LLAHCRLYVDGALAAEAQGDRVYADANGIRHKVSGGGPMMLNGSIVLCSRADLSFERFFDGSIAQLGERST
jgi:hypothetical protein